MANSIFNIFFVMISISYIACTQNETSKNPSLDGQSLPAQIQSPTPSPEENLNEWDIADRNTTRLSPLAFPQLPENIRLELQSRQYTIPQAHNNPKPHNVISGEFQKKGQTDWAVLCSRDLTSSILIFWNGSEKNPSIVASLPDKSALQGIGNEKIGYSRYIDVVGNDFIERHYGAYGGVQPPTVDHHGIDDGQVGKGSVVHYYLDGKWLRLTGAD